MSATTSGARDARMLSGVSSYGWARAALIIFIVSIAFVVPALILLLLRGAGPWMAAVIAPLFVVALAARIFGFVSTARARSERAAGYTTLPRSSPNLDQLDPRTGVLVRRAGEPFLQGSLLRGSRRTTVTDEVSPPTGSPAFPPRTARWYVLFVLAWIVPFLVVGALGIFELGGTSSNPWLFPGVALAASALPLLIGAVVIGPLGPRARCIAQQRPGVLIFTAAVIPDLTAGLRRLGSTAPPQAGRAFIVVGTESLEFWTNAHQPALAWSLPWAQVVSLRPGVAGLGNRSFPALNIGASRDQVLTQLPIGLYGRHGAFAASPGWANQVYDEVAFHVPTSPRTSATPPPTAAA